MTPAPVKNVRHIVGERFSLTIKVPEARNSLGWEGYMRIRTLVALVMLMTVGVMGIHASEEKTITGAELEAMIAQDPELNPCRIKLPAGSVLTNPVAIYIEVSNGQVTDNIVNQISVEIRREGMVERVEHFTTPIGPNIAVSGYPGCYRLPYTPGTSLTRNGTTRYTGRSALSHTSNPNILGPWVDDPIPFVLSGPTQEILAHTMRFGNQ
jgi:hypothetical protein